MTNDEMGDILTACFFAAGQGAGSRIALDYDALVWWRDRYRDKFHVAIEVAHNSWSDDRTRVLAVSRWLGQRARAHAGGARSIDTDAATRAAAEIEMGCGLSKQRTEAAADHSRSS